jgi:cold-inducible RNA-binding protein
MENKIYVGNLSYGVTDQSLADSFSAYGTVNSAKIVKDRETNRSKGFGFVEMSSAEEAQEAIDALNGKELDGRQMKVNLAKPQEPRTGGGFGGGGPRKSNNNRW